MNTKQRIDNLWRQFRESINAAYTDANKRRDEDGICLKDYAENISWSDDVGKLLASESANERQHRSNRPPVPGFSVETAAKLILMSQVAEGSRLSEIPRSTTFLVFRKTAAEARVIGYLIRNFLPADWYSAVTALDYAKLMQPKKPTCECSDPGCPEHKGESECPNNARTTVFRSDMEDRTGTPVCHACAEDCLDSGVFYTK